MKKEREGIVFALMTDGEKAELLNVGIQWHGNYGWQTATGKSDFREFRVDTAYRPTPKPRYAYADRQEEWVKANGIKVGDTVRVTREAECYEDGWGTVWIVEMNGIKEGTVTDIIDAVGIQLDNHYVFPFFVLEKVETPKSEDGLECARLNDVTVAKMLRQNQTLENIIGQLAAEKELYVKRIMELESIAPRKIVLLDGCVMVWRCPDELVPEMNK